MTQAEIEQALVQFEGLVKETANQILLAGVELEYEDVCQLLRIKVWQAVCKFNAKKSSHMKARDRHGRTPLERYVFGCLLNRRKDIEKRPRRFSSSIEELRGEDYYFDHRYMSVDDEQLFAEAEDDPSLPSTLTEVERQVVTLRLDGRLFAQIDRELGLSRAQRERVMESVRLKLADWRPSSVPRSAPTPPLPRALPRAAPAPASLAA